MVYPEYLSFSKLEESHPDTKLNNELWGNIDVLMEGGELIKRNLGKFLTRKPDEEKEVYQYRKSIFSYDPILPQCLSQLSNRLTQASFVVEGLPEEGLEVKFWNKVRENLDGNGLREREFLKTLFIELVKYNKVFIIADKPVTDEPINTLKEEIDKGVFPYFTIHSGKEVIHYCEKGGWIKLRRLYTEFNPISEDITYAEYIIIDDTYTATYRSKVEIKNGQITPLVEDNQLIDRKIPLVSLIEHKWGCLPCIKVELPSSLCVVKESYHLLVEHLRIHNNLTYTASVAGQIQRLFTPIVENANQMIDYEDAKIQAGSDKVLIGQGFSFNETSGSAINTVKDYLMKIENRIKDVIFSNGLGGDRPIQESGVAKGLDFVTQEQALESYGSILMSTLEKLYRFILKTRGYDEYELSVSGLNEFMLDSSDAKIDRIKNLEDLSIELSPTLKRLLTEDLHKSLSPNASSIEVNEIMKEIKQDFEQENLGLNKEELLDLVRERLISPQSFLSEIGLDYDEEFEKLKVSSMDKAEMEKEVMSVLEGDEIGEEEVLAEIEAEEELVISKRIEFLASYLARNSNLVERQILDELEYTPNLPKAQLNLLLADLVLRVSELTGTSVVQVRKLIYGD